MTNKSIALLAGINGKSLNEKIEITKEIVEIEYKKIVAQVSNFKTLYKDDKYVNDLLKLKDSNELFEYLYNLNVVEISLLSSYGIDVEFMNALKVSD